MAQVLVPRLTFVLVSLWPSPLGCQTLDCPTNATPSPPPSTPPAPPPTPPAPPAPPPAPPPPAIPAPPAAAPPAAPSTAAPSTADGAKKSAQEATHPKGPGFPGTDPTKAPEGFIWRGKPGSAPGSKEGNYVRPDTKESLRPDLDHPDPIRPHWDYKDPGGKWWRIGPDGKMDPK
jgi:hypothetical protein